MGWRITEVITMQKDNQKKPIDLHIETFKNVEDVPSRGKAGVYSKAAEEIKAQLPKGLYFAGASFVEKISEITGVPVAKIRGPMWHYMKRHFKKDETRQGVYQNV